MRPWIASILLTVGCHERPIGPAIEDVRPLVESREQRLGRRLKAAFSHPELGLGWVDPTHGLLLVQYEDYPSDQGGHSVRHLCGEALDEAWGEAFSAFRASADWTEPVCVADGDATDCSVPGWEFGPHVTYRFDERDRLVAIVRTAAPPAADRGPLEAYVWIALRVFRACSP